MHSLSIATQVLFESSTVVISINPHPFISILETNCTQKPTFIRSQLAQYINSPMATTFESVGPDLVLGAIAVIEYPSLSRFPKLPREVQYMIWQFAVASHGSRMVTVRANENWGNEEERLSQFPFWCNVKATATVSALLHATRDSRWSALKRWHLFLRHNLGNRPGFFDWTTDILYFVNTKVAKLFRWGHPQRGNCYAEIKEIEENLKCLIVGIQNTQSARHLNHELFWYCGIPQRYQNLEVLFLSSPSSEKSNDPGNLDSYIREYESGSGRQSGGTIRDVRHVPRPYPSLPYIFFIPRDHFEEGAHVRWVEQNVGRRLISSGRSNRIVRDRKPP